MRTTMVLALILSACGSSASEQREPEPVASTTNGTAAPAPAPAPATSGGEGDCTQIDPWATSGQSAAPCPQGQARGSRPVLDPFH